MAVDSGKTSVGRYEKGVESSGPTIVVGKSPYSPEDQKYLEGVIESNLARVKHSFANAGVDFPDDSDVFDAMVMTPRFNAEQLNDSRRSMVLPGLIALSPELYSYQHYFDFLDNNRRLFGQRPVSATTAVRSELVRQDEGFRRGNEKAGRVDEWRFGIGEMLPDPRKFIGELQDVVMSWERFALLRSLKSANYREYVMLQAQSPELLDTRGRTILRDGTSDGLVSNGEFIISACGYCEDWANGRGVHFADRDPKDTRFHVDSKIRAVLVG